MNKKILWFLGLFCIAAVLFAGIVSADDVAEEEVPAEPIQGELCGDSVYWTFMGNTLTIWGSGDMYDYYSESAPWYIHRNEIRYIEIFSGVTSVGAYAFRNLSNLINVFLPTYSASYSASSTGSANTFTSGTEGYHTFGIARPFTNLKTGAFANCKSLTEITIPSTVTNAIGAFINCTGLKTISVAQDNTTFESRNGVMINSVEHALVAYPAGKTSSHYTVPSDIETISGFAAYNCDSLQYILFPQQLEGIYLEAFYHCSNLKSAYFQSPPPTTWVNDIFSDTHPDLTLYYSSEYADSWTSPTWTDPNGITYNTCMYTPKTGDIDQDGKVTQNDVDLIAAYFAGKEPELPYFFGADIDGDGIVSRADVMYLARAVAGWDGYTLPDEDVPEAEGYTLQVQFVDSETKEKIALTKLFPPDEWNIEAGHIYNDAYIDLQNETLSDIYYQGGSLNDDLTIIDDEIVFYNVPTGENYFITLPDILEEYVLPYNHTFENQYTYGYFSIQSDCTIYIELDKEFLIVGDIAVTKENCDDIFGDSTVSYDFSEHRLILNNAKITAKNVVYARMNMLNIIVLSDTTSYLTALDSSVPVIQNISGSVLINCSDFATTTGTLHICGCSELSDTGDTDITDFGIFAHFVGIYKTNVVFESMWGAVRSEYEDIQVSNAVISESTQNSVPAYLLNSNTDIYIYNSTITDYSDSGAILIAHDNISINKSTVSLTSLYDAPQLFAVLGYISISTDSTVHLNTNTNMVDYAIISAAAGIFHGYLGDSTPLSISIPEDGTVSVDTDGSYTILKKDGSYPAEILIMP